MPMYPRHIASTDSLSFLPQRAFFLFSVPVRQGEVEAEVPGGAYGASEGEGKSSCSSNSSPLAATCVLCFLKLGRYILTLSEMFHEKYSLSRSFLL